MRLYNEKVIQEDLGSKCIAPEASKSEPGVLKEGPDQRSMLGRKGCYRSRALKATVKSLVFILKKQGSYFPFRLLFSIKKYLAPYFYIPEFFNFCFKLWGLGHLSGSVG